MKTYYTELEAAKAKQKLKAERIELNIVEDFKGILKASNNNYKFSEKNIDEAAAINKASFAILKQQIKLDETADKINKNADNLWKEFVKAAKELGVNPKETPTFKVYNEILSDLLSRPNEKSASSVLTMRLK